MATDLRDGRDTSLATLVGGIVHDAQNLISQQFALLQREIQGEIRQAKNAALSLGAGAGIVALGVVFLLVAAAHALNYYANLPLWGCYGIVGGTVTLIGAALLAYGRREAHDVHLIKPPQTAEALKENIEWLKNPTTSEHRL